MLPSKLQEQEKQEEDLQWLQRKSGNLQIILQRQPEKFRTM